jgi:hypothetical protein
MGDLNAVKPPREKDMKRACLVVIGLCFGVLIVGCGAIGDGSGVGDSNGGDEEASQENPEFQPTPRQPTPEATELMSGTWELFATAELEIYRHFTRTTETGSDDQVEEAIIPFSIWMRTDKFDRHVVTGHDIITWTENSTFPPCPYQASAEGIARITGTFLVTGTSCQLEITITEYWDQPGFTGPTCDSITPPVFEVEVAKTEMSLDWVDGYELVHSEVGPGGSEENVTLKNISSVGSIGDRPDDQCIAGEVIRRYTPTP